LDAGSSHDGKPVGPGDAARRRLQEEISKLRDAKDEEFAQASQKQRFFCLDLCKQIPKPFQVSILFNGRLIFHHFPTLHRQQQLRSNFFLRATGSIHAASL